jgi:hypothetical protein
VTGEALADRADAARVAVDGAMPSPPLNRAVPLSVSDAESRIWLSRLRADGRDRERAIAELRALLLRAARFEVQRHGSTLSHLRRGEHEDLAQQAADDAVLALLRKLDDFRGESRFTTWAYCSRCSRRASGFGAALGRAARCRSTSRTGT